MRMNEADGNTIKVNGNELCRRFKKSIATPDHCNGTGNGVNMARTPFDSNSTNAQQLKRRRNSWNGVAAPFQLFSSFCNVVPIIRLISLVSTAPFWSNTHSIPY